MTESLAELGTLTFGIATILLIVALIQQLVSWRGQLDLFLLILSVVASALWTATASYLWTTKSLSSPMLNLLEFLRDTTWFLFTFQLLIHKLNAPKLAFTHVRGPLIISVLGVALFAVGNVIPVSTTNIAAGDVPVYITKIGFLLISFTNLSLTIRLIRLTEEGLRQGLNLICIGLVILWGFDVFTYTAGLLVDDEPLRSIRGLTTATVAILVLANTRRTQWSRKIFVSQTTAFHFVFLLGALFYFSIMGTGALYLSDQGFQYGALLQIALFTIGIIFTIYIYMSDRRRAQLKVFLNKHFYNYKYDYREEWLRFIRTLSAGGPGAHLLETVIQAIIQIVGGKGGSLWLRSDAGNFDAVAHVHVQPSANSRELGNSSLVRFLKSWQWIINLEEYQEDPELYQDLQIPDWLKNDRNAWLIVPLMQDVELLGFVIVYRPVAPHRINWEDHDLLKTAGRQAATHLAQLMAVQALVEAREFQAFSRLSAFVIHDLKNLVAQLSLVVTNAAKHKNNPEFMEDAISTVQNSVAKMNRLLAQLRKGKVQSGKNTELNIAAVLHEVVRHRSEQEPRPTLRIEDQSVDIVADRDRFSSVLEHLIQNAQEATPSDGWVKVRLARDTEHAVIEISDNGCGMDAAFIRDRLFRPFDTTKGHGGMGIGAYESREYIRELKGDIHVKSEPGKGSVFTIYLPFNALKKETPPAESETDTP